LMKLKLLEISLDILNRLADLVVKNKGPSQIGPLFYCLDLFKITK